MHNVVALPSDDQRNPGDPRHALKDPGRAGHEAVHRRLTGTAHSISRRDVQAGASVTAEPLTGSLPERPSDPARLVAVIDHERRRGRTFPTRTAFSSG